MLNRSPGIHVSEIISDIATNVLDIYIPSPHDIWEVDQLGAWASEEHHQVHTLTQLGCALEHAIANRYSKQFPNRFICPGEVCKDGIFLTPDLWEPTPHASLLAPYGIIDEIKFTKYSTKRSFGDDEFWSYETQLKSYCHVFGTKVGRLKICHVNGDYSFSKERGGATFNEWRGEFTEGELRGNWAMLLKHSRSGPFLERTGRV